MLGKLTQIISLKQMKSEMVCFITDIPEIPIVRRLSHNYPTCEGERDGIVKRRGGRGGWTRKGMREEEKLNTGVSRGQLYTRAGRKCRVIATAAARLLGHLFTHLDRKTSTCKRPFEIVRIGFHLGSSTLITRVEPGCRSVSASHLTTLPRFFRNRSTRWPSVIRNETRIE